MSAAKLAKYIHQKQAIALPVDQKTAGTLVISTGLPANNAPKAGVSSAPAFLYNIVIYQYLTNLNKEKSDDKKSDNFSSN